MANYWKKKLDELNAEEEKKKASTSSKSSNYWQSKLNELENSYRQMAVTHATKEKEKDSVAPVKSSDLISSLQYDNPAAATGATIGQWISSKFKSDDDEKEKWYEGWFQSGSDDVSKKIIGSSADAGTDLLTGAIGLGEKIVDWAAGIAPDIARGQYYQNGGGYNLQTDKLYEEAYTDSKKAAAEFKVKDLINEEEVSKKIVSGLSSAGYMSSINQGGFATPEQVENAIRLQQETKQYLDNEMEEDSVFAHKVDELMQSAGQLAGTAAISATGIPWWLVTGAAAWGAESENALKEGATLDEANLSGFISATAEVLTEQISGGIKFGGNTLDDALTKRLAANISSKFWRNAAKLGMDMAGEGLEEVLSEDISSFGQWLTYQDENTLVEMLWSEEAMDAKIQAFLSGAALGGGGSVNTAVQSAVNGVDAVSGLTKNEQKVVDKEVEKRTAEQPNKKKSDIYDEVIRDMERGYISTDTIEEVLGGETYKTYQDTIKNEDALQEEFKTLNQMKQSDMTGEQIDRRNELKQQLEEIKQSGVRDQYKTQLNDEVMSLVQSDRLAESYNERSRRGQAFEADLSKYDAKQQTTIQKAIDSGILNNTNRTHEFVDMIAKITADKGVLFDFTNNERLKESGFAVDGKTVNGYVTKDGVTLNIDSAKALNSVVGHEITHVLEGTEFYAELSNAIKNYAISKDGLEAFNARLKETETRYKGIGDPDMEMTADLIGEYLFTDADFVRNLSVQHRNVFQKIYDEIKYLYKVATAGSKEARELEKVKRAFEEAYKEGGKAQDSIKYHLSSNAKTELHKALYDTKYRSEVLLRDVSPAIMVSQKGVRNLPMAMNASHIRENVFTEEEAKKLGLPVNDKTHYHGLGEEFFLKIIDGLDNVKVAYRGTKNASKPERRENYFLLVSEFKDDAGETINVPVYIDEYAQINRVFVDVNKISTAFGREAFQEYISKQIEKGDLVRIKNRDINSSERSALIAEGYGTDVSFESDASGEVNEQGSEAQATSDSASSVADMSSFVNPVESVADDDTYRSLSDAGESAQTNGNYNVYGKDIALEAPVSNADSNTELVSNTDSNAVNAEEAAPMAVAENATTTEDIAPAVESKPITTPDERRDAKLTAVQTELANNRTLRAESYNDYNQDIARLQEEYDSKKKKDTKTAQSILRRIERMKRLRDSTDADYAKRISDLETRERLVREGKPTTRQELHNGIMDSIREDFGKKGYDFDEVLKGAKNLSTFKTVDNTPQRVMEKALGYKEGQILSDITVNKVAQNETEGIKWLNSFTDRKNGLLKQISNQYHIKPGSKESAAAQMYAEGFYVDENNAIISYGDAELAKDFPDAKVQQNIKGLAADPRIRQIYDDTLAAINESRTRNAYPEIQKLDNYFLHFRAMDDTFSRLGLPFNPNDIRAKDLPTDLNGATADLKPGQPFFASAMHRKGKRTSFDLLGGLERYLTSAKNQIYHIDDIQTLRALRNHIADTYGQANGLEGLDALSEEEAQERIEKVYNSHLSTFAKFLNEEANILAGKTALIDRGLEGIIGRRGITFLNTVRKQVGSNMVGYNVSSSLTNFLPVAQTFAKTNKFDFVKAFAQTVANKTGSIFGKTDGFAESSPVMIRRKGADTFYRTAWQKVSDPGYALMGAVDSVSTELIARTKYNEFVRKGMDSQTAHIEADKWVSRLMGDRSLGQMPQVYNSKMLGLVTQFQLEVRNQLDSQFYDTIQETKVSNEQIQNGLARNAKTAAKVTSTFVQLAVVQHLFGKAFESVAGYNPAFDIIEVLLTACGFDDEEDSEDTVLDNIEEGFLALLEDLPYTSIFMDGGRIPISAALPITELVKGEDEWGNEKSRWETLGEIAPYYLMPGGYGQVKKTRAGLNMFSDEHPIAGSYTDSGNLRFPVEDTTKNRVQAAIFGQWASENARDYFDNERSPLKEKQIQEFIDLDIPIRDYWEYREGLSGLGKLGEKADYIADLDLPIDKKNLLINNIADREEDIDLTGYEDFEDFEEFDFAVKNPEKYEIAQKVGGYDAYMGYKEGMKDMKLAEKADYVAGLNLTTEQKNALINGETDRKEPIDLTGYDTSVYSGFEEFEYAKEYPEKYAVAKAVGGYDAYKGYSDALYDIKADKDEYGKSISGSRKEKVLDYINNLDADYYTKIILWKSEYTSDDTYNYEIIDYLNGRDDISFDEMVAILRKLGFDVTADGNISW